MPLTRSPFSSASSRTLSRLPFSLPFTYSWSRYSPSHGSPPVRAGLRRRGGSLVYTYMLPTKTTNVYLTRTYKNLIPASGPEDMEAVDPRGQPRTQSYAGNTQSGSQRQSSRQVGRYIVSEEEAGAAEQEQAIRSFYFLFRFIFSFFLFLFLHTLNFPLPHARQGIFDLRGALNFRSHDSPILFIWV